MFKFLTRDVGCTMELAAVLSAMATAGLESFSDTNDYYAEQDVMRVVWSGSVPLGLHGDVVTALHGLRHPLQIRDFQAGYR